MSFEIFPPLFSIDYRNQNYTENNQIIVILIKIILLILIQIFNYNNLYSHKEAINYYYGDLRITSISPRESFTE